MKLFVFGCSNSAFYHTQTFTYRQYKDFRRGEFPLTWSEILAQNDVSCQSFETSLKGFEEERFLLWRVGFAENN